MSSIITSSSVAKESYYQQEFDKENVVPEIARKVTSAATRSIMWADQIENVLEISTRAELIEAAENPLWHDMNSLGIEAMIQRNDPEELQEYEESYRMLQDPSVEGFVCDLYNPGKYVISYSAHQEDQEIADACLTESNPDLLAMISGLNDQELFLLIGKLKELMKSRESATTDMKHHFKPIGL
ncbi:MAG: hypothetical protein FJZ57_01550 [Chlamydiae bacterium]|nr:hypothetical protein [Chlamydiota bacterium]